NLPRFSANDRLHGIHEMTSCRFSRPTCRSKKATLQAASFGETIWFPEPQLSDVKHHGTPGQSQCRASHFVSILVPQELTVERIEGRPRASRALARSLVMVDTDP